MRYSLILLMACCWLPSLGRAETELLPQGSPWRVFLVCSERKMGPVTYTTAPAADWMQADFDDSGWGRYSSDLPQAVGGYGCEQSPASTVLYLRTRFGVVDPATARDLAITLEYRGGIVVYVNGQEVGRQHLPKGRLELNTPADEYPDEVTGAALPRSDRPAEENLSAYEKRIRKITGTIPASVLRKGANTLAIELHAPPMGKMKYAGRGEWSATGLSGFSLASKAGVGVASYADAVKGATLWNATPMDTIANKPGKYQSGFLWGGITVTPVGLTRGNPFEPLQPIRAVAPRGGTCSGQVVLSGATSEVKATITALKHEKSGATLPADAVQVRFATQASDEVFCNALQAKPDGAAVQPVWVVVDVPRNQPPGWYKGTLNIMLGTQPANVPVHILVSGWALPEPQDNATLVSMYQSPDTLADYFKVEPWSDKHFALIEKSMRAMAMLGNDVLLVPVVTDNYLNHKTGLIRWVKKGTGHEPDFTAFEKYLDLQTKVWGKPKIVTLSIWKHDFGTRSWFRGLKSDVVKPCMVSEYNPTTRAHTPMQAPHFGEPGSEGFWKKMTDGVRQIVKARGIDDRFLLLGEAFDSRPLEKHREFWAKIEPTMRWHIYSHFDGGEPPVKGGKFICHGGFELGFRINPNGGGLPEFPDGRGAGTNEFYVAQCQRTEIQAMSSPLSYRAVMHTSGTIARIGLDFWPIGADKRGRAASYYGCPPNEGWLWRGHVASLTAGSPDGAVRTTRAQMFLEGLQEAEVFIAFQRARAKASPELAKRITDCCQQRHYSQVVGAALPQASISLDLLGMSAREFALAAELAGQPNDGTW